MRNSPLNSPPYPCPILLTRFLYLGPKFAIMAPIIPLYKSPPELDPLCDEEPATSTISRRSRAELMPYYDDKSITDGPWEVRIVLVLSALDIALPTKGTVARCALTGL